jgi:hypothetical protein
VAVFLHVPCIVVHAIARGVFSEIFQERRRNEIDELRVHVIICRDTRRLDCLFRPREVTLA